MSTPPTCLAVMYHYVRDRTTWPEDQIRGLSEKDFIQQIDDLLCTFEPIDWDAWVQHQTAGKPLPQRSLLLTFDDGLADHVEAAEPLLRKRGLRGIFLVSGQPLEQRQLCSVHRIHLLLCRLGNDGFDHYVKTWLATHDPAADWASRVDRELACRVYHYEPESRAVLKFLVNVVLPPQMRNRMTAELFAEHVGSEPEWAARWYGTWQQWAALQEAGHTVGGHGFAHEPYLRLTAQQQLEDMQHIAGLLAEKLGPGPRPFSYPYGSHDEATMALCQQAGFADAFTTREGLNQASTPPFALRRIDTIAVDAFLSSSARQ
jgi:peptidoglycan/xylan/chitin deacetylase (PgdA/CDA1 family)